MIWKNVKLKTLLTQPIQNGYSPVCSEKPTGRWVLGLGALTGMGLDIRQRKPAPPDEKVDNYLLKKGDFIVSRSNTSDKVGRSALVRYELGNYTFSDLMMRFRVDPSLVYPEYLEVALRSSASMKYFQCIASGTSNSMVKINKTTLENLQISLPPYDIQIRIAEMVAAWDSAIEKTEQLVDAKKRMLHAVYQQYFQPNSTANSDWRRIKIGRLVKCRNEKSVPTEAIPLFSLTIEDGITAKTTRYDREFLVKDASLKTYKVVHPGDIVYNPANVRWGAIAQSKIQHKVAVSPIYEVLEVDTDRVDPDFLAHALTCPRQISIFASKTEGTLIERMEVKLDQFLALDILMPLNIGEQRNVADILNTSQLEIDLLKKLAEVYRMQERGLMQKLLTREWKVTV